MIVPSIDLMNGRAVQLRHGREFVLDGGDPLERLEQFAVAGEVAVVDLDAALGQGSNADLIRAMVRRAPCRVGGGIRSLDAAQAWLDAGAKKVVIGTAASPELCGALPRDRVIAAVDAERGKVVVEGWRTNTGATVTERIAQLAPCVGGFLFTQVEHEGAMAGFDLEAVRDAVAAAGQARITAAGGITTAPEIAALDAIGADAQVGMALYTGRLTLGRAVAASLKPSPPDPLSQLGEGERNQIWPTVVCDELGRTLGLVWSTRESLERAVAERRGIYWSRSRAALWVKGETSGNTQELLRVDLDCDRDALRFTVRQHGVGFCHQERLSCWPDRFDLGVLEGVIQTRRDRPTSGSGTARLLADGALLSAKLREEAAELADAGTAAEAVHETADLFYMGMVALVRSGGSLAEVLAELERRNGAASRRPMVAK
jgi:phosphoribosyl-ATP pyrophosphohydrolase/phosphoribosyl-AMP cyclohydrolase